MKGLIYCLFCEGWRDAVECDLDLGEDGDREIVIVCAECDGLVR